MKQLYSLLFLLLLSSVCAFGQSADSTTTHPPARLSATQGLPYPIIFIHGLNGNDANWYEFANVLKEQFGLTADLLTAVGRAGDGSRLDFNLNYDTRPAVAEVRLDYQVLVNENRLGNHDLYLINFQNGYLSNQSAIYKQGLAVRDAIKYVRNKTGADKIILMGHSMGGLAARDYLQNPDKWQSDGEHHIAKLITVGTPHGGSNLSGAGFFSALGGYEELSEAVRDLRYFYATQTAGAYLFGGIETTNTVSGLIPFFNVDINCNGRTGETIVGLNQKSIRTDLAFATVIGTGITTPTLAHPLSDGDGVVESSRANLGSYYNLTQDVFYANVQSSDNIFNFHRNLTKENYRFKNLQALDEPGDYQLAYEIKPGNTYTGFLSPQASTTSQDIDRYKVFVSEKGYFTVQTSGISLPAINFSCQIVDNTGTQYGNQSSNNGAGVSFRANVPRPGWYYLTFTANTFNNAVYNYHYQVDFQAVLDKPVISAVGSQTFCEGQSVILQGPNGYVSYRWYKDGVKAQESDKPSYLATSSGTYSLLVSRSQVESPVSDAVTVTAIPIPAKPVVTKDEKPDEVVLTASSQGVIYQWLSSGAIMAGATERTYKPDREGTYSVRVSVGQCASVSDAVTVRVEKPVITVTGSAGTPVAGSPVASICQGESVRLSGPSGYGTYAWQVSGAATGGNVAELVTNIPGVYTLTVKRGKLVGPTSEPVTVTVNPLPDTPTITLTSTGLQSSSAGNNQWLLNGQPIAGETQSVLARIGPGTYSVRVTINGCSATSSAFAVTGILDPVSAKVRVSPNPVSDLLRIESTQAIQQVDLITPTGVNVLTKRLPSRIDKAVLVSVNGLGAGVYVLRVQLAYDTVQQVKIVVQ